MGLMSFDRLRCKVRYGHLDPKKITDSVSLDNISNLHMDDRNRLLESIQAEGVRNPLIVMAYPDKLPYVTTGNNRLWAAKKAEIQEVPVIVNDWGDCFPDFEILKSLDEVRKKFIDQPNLVRSYVSGVSTSEPLINGQTWWSKE